MRAILLAIAVGMPLVPSNRAADEVVLAADGRMRAVIVLPQEAHLLEKQAARELADHLEKIVGVRPDTLTGPQAAVPAAQVPIRLGELTDARRAALLERGSMPGSFALVTADDGISVGGLGPHGTLYGTYELLEQLGVRWYMPGDLGTVLPSADRLALPVREILQTPSFSMRGVGGRARRWAERMRFGGVGPPSRLDFPAPAPFDEHPEYYALVNGERQSRQLCVSNPKVLELETQVIRDHFAEHPEATWAPVSNHGGDHCQCEGCRALDPPGKVDAPFVDGINVNDRYVWFCNRILEAIADELPEKRLVMTICTPNFFPPVKVQGHPRLDILAWANGFCRLHGVNNPACPERIRVLGYIRGWIKMLRGDYYERGNWGNIAGPGLLLPAVHRYRRDMPDYHAAGVKGFRSADYSHWISQVPSSYVGARLVWNHEADVEAILAEFYELFYGPASVPMRDYHELLERTMRDANHHTGTAIDFPSIYSTSVRAAARGHLEKALTLATGEPYAARLKATGLALDYLDTFCEMIEQRDIGRFDLSHQALEKAHALIETLLTDYDPPLLNKSFARQYLDLFFGKAIAEAHRKGYVDGMSVRVLQPEWAFRLDPQAVGEDEGWWKPDFAAEDWPAQQTWTSSWVNEGLGSYEGFAWYRQVFHLPGRNGEQRLVLWFGGVDETAKVWLNGQLLGEHAGAFRTFEFDVSGTATFGGENIVVVKTGNHTLDEVGTGGLLAPVFLYAAP